MTVNTPASLRVLLLEDSASDEKLLIRHLEKAGLLLEHVRVDTPEALRDELLRFRPEVVLSDFQMPRMTARDGLAIVRECGLDLPFIVISGTVSEEAAVEMLKAGAHDFISKGKLARLVPALERELREARVREERRRMQEHLMVSERMASVGFLAAGVAHEINNPLAAVLANLDLALETGRRLVDPEVSVDMPEREELNAMLHDAHAAADRVRAIVRDVKTFSRTPESRPFPVDVNRVLDSSLRMTANDLRHRAKVIKRYARVPAVLATEAQLGQVFLNLIVNALEALEPGRADKNRVEVSTRVSGSNVEVDITDTGPGIAPEHMDRLFTPLFTTKPAGVGTGLGLAISKKIASGLGGDLSVASTVGEGTTFTVRLPIAAEVAVPSAIKQSASELTAFVVPRRGRVLVVDDESLVTQTARRVLGRHHDVAVAFSGKTALERLRTGERYDLILCDLQMPEMPGIELHKLVEGVAAGQAARIVFMTGGALNAESARYLEAGAHRLIEKPFDASTLTALATEFVT